MTVIVFTLMLTVIGSIAVKLTRVNLMVTSNYKNYVRALYLAESGLETGKVGINWDVPTNSTLQWSDYSGEGVILIEHSALDRAEITSEATFGKSTAKVWSLVKREKPTLTNVLSALTTIGPVAANGGMVIDGRNHDLNGTLLSDSGTSGIITGRNFLQDGISRVGGTNVIDYDPSTPGDPEIITEEMPIPFTTPDGVLELPEGSLKAMAQSGIAGSQYVIDPGDLVGPLRGVTYINIPASDPWWIVAGDSILDGGMGVLIVHNGNTTATIKNLNKGTFKGLIIADDIVHIHNTIIGAVVSLTPNPSAGNVIGNGRGEILYSEEALNGFLFLETVKTIAWKELM